MSKQPTIILESLSRSFDTLEEAKVFKAALGKSYRRMWRCDYPDITFYMVEFEAKEEDT